MGHLLEQENNISDAVRHYSKAIELEPNNRSALDRQFILLRKLNRNEEAAQILRRLKSVLNDELDQEKQSFSAPHYCRASGAEVVIAVQLMDIP